MRAEEYIGMKRTRTMNCRRKETDKMASEEKILKEAGRDMEAADAMMGQRLNKFLSNAGICSRREADRRIDAGQVTVDGQPAQLGQRVLPGQEVAVDGRIIGGKEEEIILLFHKPRGIVCTAEKREKKNIVDFIGYPSRIYPVGRLDKESRGLILMTNQGDIVNRMMRAGNQHEKEYQVKVNRPLTETFLRQMKAGVFLEELGEMTRPCRVRRTGERTFRIVLTQGLNRQIRRMCQTLGYGVTDLVRVRIMNLYLTGIREGEYRRIRRQERAELERLLIDSPSTSRYVRS